MIDRDRLRQGKNHAKKRCIRRYFSDDESFEWNLVRSRRGGSRCSCEMCRNGRTSAWNKGTRKLTMQERRKLENDHADE